MRKTIAWKGTHRLGWRVGAGDGGRGDERRAGRVGPEASALGEPMGLGPPGESPPPAGPGGHSMPFSAVLWPSKAASMAFLSHWYTLMPWARALSVTAWA